MLSHLDSAFQKVMDLEGGGFYHNVAGDPGGETKWGVSKRHHPDVDIRNLTKEDARAIFEQEYWIPLYCHELTSRQMAFEVVEFAFNSGPGASALAAQNAFNDLMKASSSVGTILPDGRMGPKTVSALNRADRMGGIAVLAWVSRFNLLQLKHYRSLRPELVQRFFVGWSRRVI